jgi:hypothetical protein
VVRCLDATASSLAFRFKSEVITRVRAVAIERHSNMWNWLIGLPGRILYEKSPLCQRGWWSCSCLRSSPLTRFFDLCEFGLSVQGSWFLIQTLVQSLSWSIAIFRHLYTIWCYFQVTLVLPYTVASSYYYYSWTNGSTSPGNYEYPSYVWLSCMYSIQKWIFLLLDYIL